MSIITFKVLILTLLFCSRNPEIIVVVYTCGSFTVISDTRRTIDLTNDVISNYLESISTLLALLSVMSLFPYLKNHRLHIRSPRQGRAQN